MWTVGEPNKYSAQRGVLDGGGSISVVRDKRERLCSSEKGVSGKQGILLKHEWACGRRVGKRIFWRVVTANAEAGGLGNSLLLRQHH